MKYSLDEEEKLMVAERDRTTLVVSAKCGGRSVEIVTYVEGGVYPVKATLLFRTCEEAKECARVLTEARKPK